MKIQIFSVNQLSHFTVYICLVTLRPVVFSRLVTLYQYQSVTNTLEIDKGFSLLLYLQFFWKQPTGIVFELI